MTRRTVGDAAPPTTAGPGAEDHTADAAVAPEAADTVPDGADVARCLRVLSPPARRLVEVGAVFGPSFAVTDVAEVIGQPAGRLLDLVKEAVDAGALVAGSDVLAFRHDAVRRGAYRDRAGRRPPGAAPPDRRAAPPAPGLAVGRRAPGLRGDQGRPGRGHRPRAGRPRGPAVGPHVGLRAGPARPRHHRPGRRRPVRSGRHGGRGARGRRAARGGGLPGPPGPRVPRRAGTDRGAAAAGPRRARARHRSTPGGPRRDRVRGVGPRGPGGLPRPGGGLGAVGDAGAGRRAGRPPAGGADPVRRRRPRPVPPHRHGRARSPHLAGRPGGRRGGAGPGGGGTRRPAADPEHDRPVPAPVPGVDARGARRPRRGGRDRGRPRRRGGPCRPRAVVARPGGAGRPGRAGGGPARARLGGGPRRHRPGHGPGSPVLPGRRVGGAGRGRRHGRGPDRRGVERRSQPDRRRVAPVGFGLVSPGRREAVRGHRRSRPGAGAGRPRVRQPRGGRPLAPRRPDRRRLARADRPGRG